MIIMTILNLVKEEIINKVKKAYANEKKICVIKGSYATEFQKINNNTCRVMCYYLGNCDYSMPEPISIEDIERIFNNENIKYGYTILIGNGYVGNTHMSVEQELHLKSEYLS